MSEIQIVEKPIVGDPVAVANSLKALERRGELVAFSAPMRLSGGRCMVIASIEQAPTPAARKRATWYRRVIMIVGGTLAGSVVAGVLYVVTVAAMWVWAHAAMIGGVLMGLVVVVVVLFLSALSGDSGGTRISGTFQGRIHR